MLISRSLYGVILVCFCLETTFSLPTLIGESSTQRSHVTSFVKSKKSTTNNGEKSKDSSTLEFEEFEDFGDRPNGIGPVFHGLVKNIRRNINNGPEGDKTKGFLIKRDTEEKEISENEVYTPPGHHLNTAQEIAKHHILQKEHTHPQQPHHPHQVHHEETDHMIETETDRTEVSESIGFRVLEFFGTIAGLVWGVMTNVMKFVASGSTAALGASSVGSS
ncbi:hypothetical protein ACFFRR_000489 [Megaselia abdita]